MKKRLIFMSLASLLTLYTHIECAPGDLDFISFSTGGVIVHSLTRTDFINSCTIQSDDSIVVVGSAVAFNQRMGILRYTPNGDLDTTFNSIGSEFVLIGDASDAQSVAIQSNGKIIITGYASQTQTDIALVRFNTDGTIDDTFTTSSGSGATGNSILQQPDTKIVIGGLEVSNQANFALVRYDIDGNLDSGFGSSGKVVTSIGNFAVINQIALQADGKIIAAGSSDNGGGLTFALARYNTDGTLDTNFGTNGIVVTAIGDESAGHSVVVQPSDQYIVVGGYTIDDTDGVTKFALARYDTTGALDTNFGTSGIVKTQIQYEAKAYSIILQANEQILAGGFTYGDLSTDFALARYDTDGTLDTGFGTSGVSITNPGIHNSESRITSLALQSTGKIIAAGFNDTTICIARFHAV